MPFAAANVSSAAVDAFTMHNLIGLIMTQFPFAAAALALKSEFARDQFARLCSAFRTEHPENLLIAAKGRARRN